MRYIKPIDTIKAVFVIVFFDMLLLTQSFLKRADYVRLVDEYEILTIGFILFVIVASMGVVVIKKNNIEEIMLMVGPFLFITMVSIIEVKISHDIPMNYTIAQNTIAIMPALCAYFVVKFFGKKALDLITYACLINYTIYVVMYFYTYKIFGLTHFFDISESHNYKNYLEVHEVTFIMGMLLIFYCLDSFKDNIRKISWLALYVFLGYKRILFPAIALGLYVGFVIMKKEKKFFVNLFSMISFVIVAGWLAFVTSPYYELLAALFNIELNSRSFSGTGLYGRLTGYYYMGVSYVGHGVGFVLSTMQEYAQYGFSGTLGFHNDILKYYIDLGFIPFFIFIILRIFVIPNVLFKKRSAFDVGVYVGTLMMTLICWTTDNLASYPNYLFVSFAIIAYTVFGKNEKDGSTEK